MDELFLSFLQDIPREYTDFVLELDKYVTSRGSRRTIKAAKSGFVTSYSSPVTGRALFNYVFRKNGVKMRIYAEHIGEHLEILCDFPAQMKADMKKAGDCKKLTGRTCTPTCPAGYTFLLDGAEYRKCKNTAFFHALEKENLPYLKKLIEVELVF